jgi:hypothetical protein
MSKEVELPLIKKEDQKKAEEDNSEALIKESKK